jgi:hypothetical protein
LRKEVGRSGKIDGWSYLSVTGLLGGVIIQVPTCQKRGFKVGLCNLINGCTTRRDGRKKSQVTFDPKSTAWLDEQHIVLMGVAKVKTRIYMQTPTLYV